MDTLPQTPVGIFGQCTGRAPAGIMPVIIQATKAEEDRMRVFYMYILFIIAIF